jgi:hypothetical protein
LFISSGEVYLIMGISFHPKRVVDAVTI